MKLNWKWEQGPDQQPGSPGDFNNTPSREMNRRSSVLSVREKAEDQKKAIRDSFKECPLCAGQCFGSLRHVVEQNKQRTSP